MTRRPGYDANVLFDDEPAVEARVAQRTDHALHVDGALANRHEDVLANSGREVQLARERVLVTFARDVLEVNMPDALRIAAGNGDWTSRTQDAWPGFSASNTRNWRIADNLTHVLQIEIISDAPSPDNASHTLNPYGLLPR